MAIVAVSALVVWEASAGHIANTVLRATLAAMVVLIPIVGVDSLANVTFSIWFLTFASFWILLWRPATKAGVAVGALVIFVSVLSNGEMLVLLPLWFLRVMAIRQRSDVVIVGSFALGTALQFAAAWGNTTTVGEQGGVHSTVIGHWHWSLLPAYLQRVVGSAFFGQRVNGLLWVHIGVVLEGLLLLALVAVVVVAMRSRDGRLQIFVPVAVGTSVVMFLAAGYQRQVGSEFLWPSGSYDDNLSHYMIVPCLLLVSVLLVLLDRASRRSLRWTVASFVGAAFILVLAPLTFSVGSVTQRGDPTWTEALAGAQVSCHVHQLGVVDVPIAPMSVGETIMVPCTKVLDVAQLPYRARSDLRTWANLLRAGSVIVGGVFLHAGTSGSIVVSSLRFEVTGPSDYKRSFAGSLTAFGWLGGWDSRSGPNGAYSVQSVAQDTSGAVARSAPIAVTVANPVRKSDPHRRVSPSARG